MLEKLTISSQSAGNPTQTIAILLSGKHTAVQFQSQVQIFLRLILVCLWLVKYFQENEITAPIWYAVGL